MNDVMCAIPHALYIVYYVISFREVVIWIQQICGDPEHRITLCEINSIKNDNIDGYIINLVTNLSFLSCVFFQETLHSVMYQK